MCKEIIEDIWGGKLLPKFPLILHRYLWNVCFDLILSCAVFYFVPLNLILCLWELNTWIIFWLPQVGHREAPNGNAYDLLSSYCVSVLKSFHHQSHNSPENEVLFTLPNRWRWSNLSQGDEGTCPGSCRGADWAWWSSVDLSISLCLPHLVSLADD